MNEQCAFKPCGRDLTAGNQWTHCSQTCKGLDRDLQWLNRTNPNLADQFSVLASEMLSLKQLNGYQLKHGLTP